MRRLWLVLVALLLSACSGTVNVPATATRAVEQTQVAVVLQPTPTTTRAATFAPERPTTAPASELAREPATVVSVTDGDTIRVRLANGAVEPVRYIGIDAPETVDPRTTVECFGREASERNAGLVQGRAVLLEKDVSERDRYDRLLRYVWVVGDDGIVRFVNEELVKWGFAAASSYPPDVRYQQRFSDAQAGAQRDRLGLWNLCPGAHAPLSLSPTPIVRAAPAAPPSPSSPPVAAPPTVAPRPPSGRVPGNGSSACPAGYPIKGNLTTSSGDRIYHVPGGQFYNATKPEECFATEADAQSAGYRRSLR